MLVKFTFFKTGKSFYIVFPWIWSLSSDSTKPNDFGFMDNFDAILWCEDEIEKSWFFS